MKYVAATPVTVQAGQLVRLSKAQLERCKHLVKPADKPGWHEATAAFQFKRGESFELDAELPKGMADSVKSAADLKAEAKAAAEAQAKAEAEAKAEAKDAAEAQAKAEAEAKAKAAGGGAQGQL